MQQPGESPELGRGQMSPEEAHPDRDQECQLGYKLSTDTEQRQAWVLALTGQPDPRSLWRHGLSHRALREALHARGMLTVGIPKTIDPLLPSPTPEDVARMLDEADVHGIRIPTQVHLACACGYSRPVVERLMASLLCRGAGRLTYKGHRGAIVQIGMAVMAHNAATLVRIHDYRLSKRACMFHRWPSI